MYAKFVDMEWYRAIILTINQSNLPANLLNTTTTTTTDNLDDTFESSVFLSSATTSYEVYFIDYGNKHTILSHIEICPIGTLLEHIKLVEPADFERSAQQAICSPARALCCCLDEQSIARTDANLLALQKLNSLDSFFDIERVLAVDRCPLIVGQTNDNGRRAIDVFKYRVRLSQAGRLVDDMLEKIVPVIVNDEKLLKKQQLVEATNVCFNADVLKPGRKYLCRLAHLEMESGEIFVNMLEEYPKLVNL